MRNRSMMAVFVGVVLAVPALGCMDFESEDVGNHNWPIINGSPTPSGSPYDAVVSLHQTLGKRIYISPFCSGTLITPDVVLTAGHCLANKQANKVAVYFGDSAEAESDAGTLDSSDFHMVSEVLVHPDYNSQFITNDIALMRLTNLVAPELAEPVSALPESIGLTPEDEDVLVLDFAGFGYDENGDFGTKLHVLGKLDHLQGDHQIYYYQPWDEGGPCSGDSGGPAFVNRNGTDYVGGMTSYGDANCSIYGVSTRADSFESFINTFAGGGPDCSADGVCNTDCSDDPDCSSDPFCGDRVCTGGETCDSCPEDCVISHPKKGELACCGDGVCYKRETAAQCPADCG